MRDLVTIPIPNVLCLAFSIGEEGRVRERGAIGVSRYDRPPTDGCRLKLSRALVTNLRSHRGTGTWLRSVVDGRIRSYVPANSPALFLSSSRSDICGIAPCRAGSQKSHAFRIWCAAHRGSCPARISRPYPSRWLDVITQGRRREGARPDRCRRPCGTRTFTRA